MHIDHTTIRTSRLVETKDFFVSVFDLAEGPRPARIAENINGYWLYYQGAPIVHLIESYANGNPANNLSSEAIDHTAFFMTGYESFKEKLRKLKVHSSLMDLPEIGERRIFLYTPTGVLLETVFRENADQ